MKIELGTEKLREAVSKVFKGAGNSDIKLLTTIIGIEGRNGNLYLTATDEQSTITVAVSGVLSEDEKFYTAVNAETFKKIIDRTTSPTVTLSIEENRIVFTGNGDYNLEICMNNEDGDAVPARIIHREVEGESQIVDVSDLKKIYTYLRGFVSVNQPKHMMYKIHDGYVLAYDSNSAGIIKTGIIGDMAFSKSFVNLFDTLDGEKAKLTVQPTSIGDDGIILGESLKVESDSVLITSSVAIPVEANIVGFVNMVVKLCNSKDVFTKDTVIDRSKFLDMLGRISIFVTTRKDDPNILDVEVDNKEAVFVTKNKNCVESLKFDECVGDDSIIMNELSHPYLLSAVSAIRSEKMNVAFSQKPGLRFYDEKEKLYIIIPYQRKN